MAGLRRPQPGGGRRTAAAVNLLLGVFQVLLPCCRPGGAQGQAIEPLPNVVELWQAEEGELLLPTQGDSEDDGEEPSQEQSFSEKLFSGKGLHFQPSFLDFGIQFLGHPAAKILYAYNPSRESEVVVNSVFTAARHFHVSPFRCRVIPAMGKTSFRIIFFPTEEGSIESSLFINTSSHGVLSYHVSGIGTRRISTGGSTDWLPNAYFLLPQVQSIQLSETQVATTNTSLLQVQLECSLHNKVCQQLKSCYLESDEVLQLQMSIIVTMENSSKELEENTQDLLDHLSIVYVATDKPETSDDSAVNMYVLHSGNSLIWIQDVHHFSHRNDLSLQFEPVLLPTSTTNFTKIASFTCKATSCDGGVTEVMKKKTTPTLNACLASPVIQGYFRVETSAAQFLIEGHENSSGGWSIWCLNYFDHGVVLKDVFVSKETKHILKILNFTGPLFLPPGCWNIFSLKLAVKDIAINLFTNVFLTTNTGAIFAIPLHIFSAPTKEGSLGFEVIAHCGMHYFMGKSKAENPNWDKSLSLDQSTWSMDSELATKLYERWKKYKNGDVCRRNVLGVAQFAHLKKSKELESFVSFLPGLVAEPGLVINFSATALRNSVVKYFMVRNPSSLPVSLQLLPLSLYPKPEAAVRLLHKWFGTDMQMVNFTTGEFQLTKACPYLGVHSEESRFGTLHLHLQPLEMRRVGVIFTPADYGKVTSLILIRNNLTGIDMIGVEGLGARELLKVGGRLPGTGGSLRFKVPESTLMDCRRLELKDSKQILSITKNFKVENIGPLPITVSSLKISGYHCQGYGFEVLDCHQFSLSPNTSRDISIVFTPDFTSSWVIRELTLVTAANLEFHFTLNVTLPHHLLPLCADVVPGPSWEEAFWRLTVFFVSLSLLGVILIAFQQAQYILTEFMKTRQRQHANNSSQQSSSPMDVINSHSHKSNCKNFLDTYSPSDKGRGKSCLPVSTPQSRSQNAAKRSPATCGHSQKKHKCSVYYSRHKASAATAIGANATAEEKHTLTLGTPLSAAKEDACTDVGENWVNLKYASGMNVNLQKNLTLPKNLLNKEENTLKDTVTVNNTSSECSMKEGMQTCMFPKETDLKTENMAEFKEQELCPLKNSKKLLENPLPRTSPQYHQSDLPEVSRKHNGTNQVPVKNEVDSCETLKKNETKSPSEKKIHKVSKEDVCSEKQDIPSVEQEDSYRKKKLQEKREGNVQNLNWNKNRTCRKNKKKGIAQASRPTEQSELKLLCGDFERSELRGDMDVRSWCIQENTGEVCKVATEMASSSSARREEEGYYQKPEKKPSDKFCLDSSSECGSSSGSVRASRGSWGSWSSSGSSDGDRKPAVDVQHFLPPGDSFSSSDFPSETPISLNLSHHICSPTDVSDLLSYADPSCPSLPAGSSGVEEDKGLYSPGDLWPPEPVCLANSFSCPMENMPGVTRDPVHNSSFIDWNATCEGQFPNVYCPLELNDYNAFPEENMNYTNGFPCPAEAQTDFIDHNSHSTWNTPPNMPTAWGHASFVNSQPYLTSTRSLSPMSGLFGSIWAPQSDVYENCCPISSPTEHSTHMENQAVMCKEYYPGFNPFRAYMNLDIWTSTANRNTNFPLSRDSSYCGNV
ncbi:transmembrane protein 131-like isoform X3 [Perognathus longimembris pacificus]|uniref:transmembrane protein 131-like isoform X3 n=1 Tax=Perognathus longimembris pacificus TaxID=214514 RepID=UPI00201A1F91|nr:transmembrane protein 131-like isoform X3 [Perognathus longimembris pacificus]